MKRFLQMLFFAMLAAVAVSAVVFVFPSFHKHNKIQKRYIQSKKDLKKQTDECIVLRRKLHNVKNSTSEIEKISREKFNYCKEGETVYKFNSNSEIKNITNNQ